jgi:GntR family transcriptional regulator
MPARPSRIDEVRDGLLSDLLSGATPVGTKLPNEQNLATRFGVSRATVREAVGGLVESGYLLRRHGSGTFVTSPPGRQHALDTTLSYTQMIRQAGMTAGLRLLGTVVRPADAEEARDLGLDDGAAVRVLERLRTADGRPVIYSIDMVAAHWLDRVADEDLATGLYEVLDAVGAHVRTASAVLLPVVADRRLAELLEVRRGTALQRIDEVDYTADARPIMRSTEWHVPGIFELRVHRRS